jgi:putative membrane protein
MISHKRYLSILASLYLILFIALGINPVDRQDWLLESTLPVLFVALAFFTYRRLLFSRLSYSLIFIFMCLHAIGAHYTVRRQRVSDRRRPDIRDTSSSSGSWSSDLLLVV